MRRTTISLPDDLADALERDARRRSQSASAVMRDALRSHLGLDEAAGPRPLPFANLGSSGDPDLARNIEEILAKEWVDDVARGR